MDLAQERWELKISSIWEHFVPSIQLGTAGDINMNKVLSWSPVGF